MTRQQRLLLNTLLAAWVGLVLACGGTSNPGGAKKADPPQQTVNDKELQEWTVDRQQAEAAVETMLDKEGLSDNEKHFVRGCLNKAWTWNPSVNFSKPSLNLSKPVRPGDLGVPYYPLPPAGTTSTVGVVRIIGGDEMVVNFGRLWIKGVSTAGLTEGISKVDLKGVFFADGTKEFTAASGKKTMALYLAAIDVKKVELAMGSDEVKTLVSVVRKIEEERQRREQVVAEAARKAEEELDFNGLVLLRKTVTGESTKFATTITGTVVNRRNHKLAYAEIKFNVYDTSGARVGTAWTNINGLEPGSRWNFKAVALVNNGSSHKLAELSGY